jgi:hypothetical protein
MAGEIVRLSGKQLTEKEGAVGKGIDGVEKLPAIVEEAGPNARFAYEEFLPRQQNPWAILGSGNCPS